MRTYITKHYKARHSFYSSHPIASSRTQRRYRMKLNRRRTESQLDYSFHGTLTRIKNFLTHLFS